MPKNSHGPENERWAQFWRVNVRTIQRWRTARPRLPFDNPGAMAQHIIGWPKATPACKAVAQGILLAKARVANSAAGLLGAPPAGDGAGAGDTSAEAASAPPTALDEKALGEAAAGIGLSERATRKNIYTRYLDTAIKLNEQGGIKFWSDRLSEINKDEREEMLLRNKLKLDQGTAYPAEEFCRLIRQFVFWVHQATVQGHRAAAEKFINLAFPEEADALLRSFLRGEAFFRPLVEAGRHLPPLLRRALHGAIDDYVEDAAAHLPPIPDEDALPRAPAPPPPQPPADSTPNLTLPNSNKTS